MSFNNSLSSQKYFFLCWSPAKLQLAEALRSMCVSLVNTHSHPMLLFMKSNVRVRLFSANRQICLPALPLIVGQCQASCRVKFLMVWPFGTHHITRLQPKHRAVLRQARSPWLLWFPYAYLLSKLKKKKSTNKLLLFESKVSSKGLILSLVFLRDSGALKRWALMHKSLWEPWKGTEGPQSLPAFIFWLLWGELLAPSHGVSRSRLITGL